MGVRYQDYYETLGVSRTATPDEIRSAYRKLARQHHPDVAKGKGSDEKFKAVSEAYEVLSDPQKRAQYDQLGANWKAGQEFRPPPGWAGRGPGGGGRGGPGRGAAGAGGFDFGMGGAGGFSDFFEAIFGGQGGDIFETMRAGGGRGAGADARSWAGADQEAEVTISFAEAFAGGTRRLTLTSPEEGGTPRTLELKIPPGTTDGAVLRLAGQGGAGAGGGSPGDLLLRVRVEPDPAFRLEGANVVTMLSLAPWEAALGAKVPVPTPEGEVTLTVPPGTQSGQRLRLRGRGFPRRGGARGDLLAEARIVVPRALSPEQRELFERLAASEPTFDPRRS